MHALWLSALLLSQAPANADRTETIGLAFISAADVEQSLFSSLTQTTGPRSSSLVPQGVHAWSIDARSNSITVTGEPDALQWTKNIIRLLDVPPRRLSIEVRFVPLETSLPPNGALYTTLSHEEAAALASRSSSRAWNLPATNNHPVHFRAPLGGEKEPDVMQEITPRVNGDGSITVIVGSQLAVPSTPGAKAAPTEEDPKMRAESPGPVKILPRVVIGQQRVASGQPLAIAFPKQGIALWIRPTLPPDEVAPDKVK